MNYRSVGTAVVVLLILSTPVLLHSFSLFEKGLDTSPRPGDAELQREDRVVVSDRLAQIEPGLRLLTHRVDSIRGGDTTRYQIRFRLKTRDISAERGGSQLVRLRALELNTIGFEGHAEGSTGADVLAHTDFADNKYNITIYLPRTGRVSDISGLSYEFVVAHELASVGLRQQGDLPSKNRSSQTPTTDYILARRGVSEGIASRVGEIYTEKYSGNFDPQVLQPDDEDHPHDRVIQWAYYEGYEFTRVRRTLSSQSTSEIRSTYALLHPSTEVEIRELPDESFAERLDSVDQPEYTDRPGPLVIRTALASRGVSLSRASGVVTGWQNGRIDRYFANNTIVSVWTTVWQNETEAAEFARVYHNEVPVSRADSLNLGKCQSVDRLLLVNGRRVFVVRCS